MILSIKNLGHHEKLKNRYAVVEIKFPNYKKQILNLRQRVWTQTDPAQMQQIFINGFYDGHDDTSFHWVVFNNERKIIASARLSIHNSIHTLPDSHLLKDVLLTNIQFPLASLNRLVVDKKYQGESLSDVLDKARIQKAIESACCSACVMTYGQRGKKLIDDGFQQIHLLKLEKDFETNKENAKHLPPAFFYKIL